MELYPGKSLTPEQLKNSKCNSKYNAIKKAFSEFTGKPYNITPVYQKSPAKKTKKFTKIAKDKTKKNRS